LCALRGGAGEVGEGKERGKRKRRMELIRTSEKERIVCATWNNEDTK